jgi:hypothetical protein
MLRKELGISLFVGLLLVGLSGTAFAGGLGSEAGVDTVLSQGTLAAAQSHNYDAQSLAVIGTEAGDWKFNVNAPESKADVAAAQYNYNQDRLDLIGTEGGVDSQSGSAACPC